MIESIKKKIKTGDIVQKRIAFNDFIRLGYNIEKLVEDSDFLFDEENHVYTHNGTQLESVSTFAKNFYKPFNSAAISAAISKRTGVPREEILSEWRYAGTFGSECHFHIENYIRDKIMFESLTGWSDENVFERLTRWEKTYKELIEPFYEVVSLELRLFNKKLGLAGTIDALFRKDGKYYIFDWKTNKRMDTDEDRCYSMMLDPFTDQKDNHLNKYSIQLCLYAILLEEYGVEVGGMYICHVGPEGPGRVIECKDYRSKLRFYVNKYKKKKDIKEIKNKMFCPI